MSRYAHMLKKKDGNVLRTAVSNIGSPVYDLSKQLQILNLGESNKSKSKQTNFLSAPLQSIENLNSITKNEGKLEEILLI